MCKIFVVIWERDLLGFFCREVRFIRLKKSDVLDYSNGGGVKNDMWCEICVCIKIYMDKNNFMEKR